MADKMTPARRSYAMSRVRRQDTHIEQVVRAALHQSGFRFRKNVKSLPGKPDIVLPKHKKVIFVHGCFWHGHEGCIRAKRPSTNIGFWNKKIDSNILRDQNALIALKALGWKVMVIWECEGKIGETLHKRLSAFLET